MGYRVVVAGATGNVGREMLNILAEREFPIDELAVLASSRSVGDTVDFGETGKQYKIQNIEHFDPTGWDMALFAIGNTLSALAPSYGWMLAFRFLAGLPHGAYFGIASLVAASCAEALRAAQAYSLLETGASRGWRAGVALERFA